MAFLNDLLLGAGVKTWVIVIIPSLVATYWVLWIVYARTLHPLAKVPGDFWPSVSRTWHMYHVYKGDLTVHMRAMHEKYGPLIRIAPNEVLSADPEAIQKIYPTQRPLEKADFYIAWRNGSPGARDDLFTSNNEREHAEYRSIVGNVYTMTNVLRNETNLDDVLALFYQRLGEFAEAGKSFDFGRWLEMCAYDNVGIIFMGKQFGFLETGKDYGNFMHALHLAFPFLTFVATAPRYARPFILGGGAVIPKVLKALIAVGGITDRAEKEMQASLARSEDTTSKRVDLLSQFMTIVHQKGEKVGYTPKEVRTEMVAGTFAGVDSTAATMRTIFYHLMKNPETMKKAQAEIDAAFADGTLSHPVMYNKAIKLPYLQAVIKEAARIYPAWQVPMPRVSPAQGLELSGIHIPAGFIAGMSPACVQRDKTVFGDDANEFKPERWLESEERTRLMERAMLNFGAGTRTCIGKHVALSEINKIVPEVLRRFDIEMAHDQPWKTHVALFVTQWNVLCKLTKRELA